MINYKITLGNFRTFNFKRTRWSETIDDEITSIKKKLVS